MKFTEDVPTVRPPLVENFGHNWPQTPHVVQAFVPFQFFYTLKSIMLEREDQD